MMINGKLIKPKFFGLRKIEDRWGKGFVVYVLFMPIITYIDSNLSSGGRKK